MSEQQPRWARTYGQIWQEFRDEYVPRGLSERELRQIHLKWIQIRALVTGRAK